MRVANCEMKTGVENYTHFVPKGEFGHIRSVTLLLYEVQLANFKKWPNTVGGFYTNDFNEQALKRKGAAVMKRTDLPPPTRANRVRFPAGSRLAFRMWESCCEFSRDLPFPHPSIPASLRTHITSPASALKTSINCHFARTRIPSRKFSKRRGWMPSLTLQLETKFHFIKSRAIQRCGELFSAVDVTACVQRVPRRSLVSGRSTFSFSRSHSGYWLLLRAPSVYSTEETPAHLATLHHKPLKRLQQRLGAVAPYQPPSISSSCYYCFETYPTVGHQLFHISILFLHIAQCIVTTETLHALRVGELEALGVRVSVAPVATSLLDLGRASTICAIVCITPHAGNFSSDQSIDNAIRLSQLTHSSPSADLISDIIYKRMFRFITLASLSETRGSGNLPDLARDYLSRDGLPSGQFREFGGLASSGGESDQQDGSLRLRASIQRRVRLEGGAIELYATCSLELRHDLVSAWQRSTRGLFHKRYNSSGDRKARAKLFTFVNIYRFPESTHVLLFRHAGARTHPHAQIKAILIRGLCVGRTAEGDLPGEKYVAGDPSSPAVTVWIPREEARMAPPSHCLCALLQARLKQKGKQQTCDNGQAWIVIEWEWKNHGVKSWKETAISQVNSPSPFPFSTYTQGAAVAERLARSPPTKANRVQCPAGSPEFRKWESCGTMPLVGRFSRDPPFPPALHSGAAPYSLYQEGSYQETAFVFARNGDDKNAEAEATAVGIRGKCFASRTNVLAGKGKKSERGQVAESVGAEVSRTAHERLTVQATNFKIYVQDCAKDDRDMHINSLIASKRKAQNWHAVLLLITCLYETFNVDTTIVWRNNNN
ncbi:hypothetical protein PR048_002326 [Dryococelus australis]|uniref:Uncharacterized protein n=1 Tax=Dryococelus australis TaxID=614101 RepID=A0ABQ9ILD3_9NEOP|nr:hypothetical protein PR048_002326 [Dryococelus australis]